MGEFVNDEQKKAHIASLLKEQEGYEERGNSQRAGEVAEELRRLGDSAQRAAKRAAKRKPKVEAEDAKN